MIYRQCEFTGNGKREANICPHGVYWPYYPGCKYYKESPRFFGGICLYPVPEPTPVVIRIGTPS